MLTRLAAERLELSTVMIAHLLGEVPASVTHALLLSTGRVLAAGPVEDVLSEQGLSAFFGRRVAIRRGEGRWSAVTSSLDRRDGS